jgi:hypothetical protein
MTNNEQEKVESVEQDRIKDISTKLEAFLIENGVALQPVLISNQFGIRPYVQLVDVPKSEEQKEEPKEEKAEEPEVVEPEVIAQA